MDLIFGAQGAEPVNVQWHCKAAECGGMKQVCDYALAPSSLSVTFGTQMWDYEASYGVMGVAVLRPAGT